MAVLMASNLLGWQVALSGWRATPFCPSHLLFSLLSQPCPLHCQIPSRLRMLCPPTGPAGGGGSDRTVVGGQLQKFKGIKSLIEESQRMRWLKERRTVRWTVKRKKTYFLLCEHLAVLLNHVFVLGGTGQRLRLLYNETFSLTS